MDTEVTRATGNVLCTSAPGNGTRPTDASEKGPSDFGGVDFARMFPRAFGPQTPEQQAEERRAELAQQEAKRRWFLQDRLRKLREAMGPRYQDCTFNSFDCSTDEQARAVDALREYAANAADNITAGRGVVLFGPSGSGKDHLAGALAKAVIVARPETSLKWVNGLDIWAEARDRIGRNETEKGLVEELVRPHVLLLSDPLPPGGALTDFQAALLLR
ncbi:MAG: ATP-binding protein, partial [Thermoguttaceae bacterium]|nr:ATP-binding protein [Thermoguttaceae bacterium]